MLFTKEKYVPNILMAAFFTRIIISECRVMCKNSYTGKWNETGMTCPVNCANVRAAIEKLQLLDRQKIYQSRGERRPRVVSNSLTLQLLDRQKIYQSRGERRPRVVSNSLTESSMSSKLETHDKVHKKTYKTHAEQNGKVHRKIVVEAFRHLKDIHGLVRSLNDMMQEVYFRNESCLEVVKEYAKRPTPLLKKIVTYCTKRSNQDTSGDFITKMTKILNYHSKGFKFNNRITMILLRNLLRETTNLRQGLFDVNRVITIMKPDHEPEENGVIHLMGRNCININMPGCYCEPHFVEDNGHCVKIARCAEDKDQAKYIRRILVN